MNNKVFFLAAAGCLALGFTSCSHKLGQFRSDYFSTTPTPLETVGENVPGTVHGNIPAKFMVKNAKVTATPVLQWETNKGSGEASSQPVIFQGQDVRANGQVVNYTSGGTVNIPFSMPYVPEMAKSNLYLDFSVDQNGKVYTLPRVKVGEGVIATSTLASAKTVTPPWPRITSRKSFPRNIQPTSTS